MNTVYLFARFFGMLSFGFATLAASAQSAPAIEFKINYFSCDRLIPCLINYSDVSDQPETLHTLAASDALIFAVDRLRSDPRLPATLSSYAKKVAAEFELQLQKVEVELFAGGGTKGRVAVLKIRLYLLDPSDKDLRLLSVTLENGDPFASGYSIYTEQGDDTQRDVVFLTQRWAPLEELLVPESFFGILNYRLGKPNSLPR